MTQSELIAELVGALEDAMSTLDWLVVNPKSFFSFALSGALVGISLWCAHRLIIGNFLWFIPFSLSEIGAVIMFFIGKN